MGGKTVEVSIARQFKVHKGFKGVIPRPDRRTTIRHRPERKVLKLPNADREQALFVLKSAHILKQLIRGVTAASGVIVSTLAFTKVNRRYAHG